MASGLFENDEIKDNKARDFFYSHSSLIVFSFYCFGLGII